MIMEARKVRKQQKIIDFSIFSIFLRFFLENEVTKSFEVTGWEGLKVHN